MSIGNVTTSPVHHHTPVRQPQSASAAPKARVADADDAKPAAKAASAAGVTATLGNHVNVHA